MQIPKMDLAAIILDGNTEILEKYRNILHKDGIRKIKCKNCGKYFIFNPKQPSEYCNERPSSANMTCRQIGAQSKYKENISPIQKAFTNALKRENKKLHQTGDSEQYELWKKEKSKLRKEFSLKYEIVKDEEEKQKVLDDFKNKLKIK